MIEKRHPKTFFSLSGGYQKNCNSYVQVSNYYAWSTWWLFLYLIIIGEGCYRVSFKYQFWSCFSLGNEQWWTWNCPISYLFYIDLPHKWKLWPSLIQFSPVSFISYLPNQNYHTYVSLILLQEVRPSGRDPLLAGLELQSHSP